MPNLLGTIKKPIARPVDILGKCIYLPFNQDSSYYELYNLYTYTEPLLGIRFTVRISAKHHLFITSTCYIALA